MPRGTDKWLLVEWNDGGLEIVHIRSLVNTNYAELQPGSPLTALLKGTPKQGALICKASNRRLVDQAAKEMKAEAEADLGTNAEEVAGDFAESPSSWQPSENISSESDEAENVDQKKQEIKIERSKNRILTPSNRMNTEMPEATQRGNTSVNKKRKIASEEKQSSPNSNRSNVECNIDSETAEYVARMKNCLRDLFIMTQNMKSLSVPQDRSPAETNCTNAMTNFGYGMTNFTSSSMKTISVDDDDKENELSPSLESERSEDNKLISNKYKQYKNKVSKTNPQEPKPSTSNGQENWYRIGSGKTILSEEKYNSVNWKSFSTATRTLLLALFPRRILATHSLTGKKSPAFQNKPAKMCLDPKIISDVIIEISRRYSIKESFIRGIITTKCADESKMLKTRLKKRAKTKSAENRKKQENGDDTLCNKTT